MPAITSIFAGLSRSTDDSKTSPRRKRPGAKRHLFWIEDDQPLSLKAGEQFSILVRRSSDPAPGEYARISLYYREEAVAAAAADGTTPAPTPPAHNFHQANPNQLLAPQTAQDWFGNRRVTFCPLEIVGSGVYTVRVDVMKSRGGPSRDKEVDRLYSQEICVA
ncbi:hypothetical protein GGS23DRAFT_562242 [Durotheca rogersii]|uniref:uncharacterized protein n=1 Tax=Durotheca rogersii TaxID=419775 RepID=UPI0022202583|nr:uncharacterized protein GGS23DRAFT_562242 [Durotheca rogersii]KAI5864880.1 hypothetical protein GGS23DRAFT_562242 [Durotheca rogersii]